MNLNVTNEANSWQRQTFKLKTVEFDTKKAKRERCCFAIKQIWEFLESYVGLANTHGAEFILEQHWNKFVPHAAQDSVLNLNYDELVKLPLYHHVVVDVGLTEHHDYEASQLQEEEHNHNPTPCPCHNDDYREKNGGTLTKMNDNKWLSSFTHQAYQCHLENLNILTSLSEAVGYQNMNTFKSHDVVSEAMSEKKVHEVGIMSEAVVATFSACQADIIVDIGSGKGYLGAEVSRSHVISVLGMDSSETNTHGAIRRDAQLGKRWNGLVKRKGKPGSYNKSCCAVEQKQSNKGDNQHHTITKAEGTNVPTDLDEASEIYKPDREKQASHNPDNEAQASHNPDREKQASHNTDKEAQASHKPDIKPQASHNLYVPITKFVHPEMNLRQVIQQHAPHLFAGTQAKLLLTGLHTCGSLAVTMMRLFVQDPGAAGLCCVGCCYQLMEEPDKNSSTQISEDVVHCHFPVSHYGQQLDLHLGRNARNLASQSVHRIQASGQLQGGDFYWRALLDVVIKQLGLSVPEKIKGMRGLHKKCQTFQEYVKAAFKKLGLSPDLISGELLSETEELYKHTKSQMVAFFQLKLVLAPLIEALILLDRLLFLLEQDEVHSADLVQLFDPVTSPRCYALIAVKSQT
ncbi:unnamed protein product [Lymnaea stagnalis]|uniref:Methyltransferase domain-containing protein n=1 Tax=Lymnaea stagnalis TaxID=6523 RepID=A0AAV2H3U6_LYMST